MHMLGVNCYVCKSTCMHLSRCINGEPARKLYNRYIRKYVGLMLSKYS